ncbi:MAG: glycosyltransferase [Pedobacter sp.]|nr:MAG: glycosyltransferase [Pedobacter sp.]
MQKKISVIIPVYNGENFIDSCLNSIFTQEGFSLDELEILLLNDGSRDGSLEILRRYEKQQSSVRVIDQKNMGAAKTRNKGMRLATAEYTTLIDQDDTIASDYFKTLYSAIVQVKSDVVQSGFKLVNKDGETVKQVLPITTEFGKFLAIPAWAKLYRTSFLIDNNIEFFDNNIGEDSIFTTDVIIKAERYSTIRYAGYLNSFDNSENVTNTLHKGLSKSVNIIGLLDRLHEIQSTDTTMQKMLEYNIIRTASYYLLSYGRYAEPQRFYDTYKEIFTWIDTSIPSVYGNRYLYIKPKGEHLSASGGVVLLALLHKVGLMKLFAIMYCKRGNHE